MKTIVCADALQWLQDKRDVGAIVTSLPDAEEIGLDVTAWEAWFTRAVGLSVAAASASAPAIFYQTDRKAAGSLYSKAALVIAAAQGAGARVLWHKIVLRRDVGMIDIHRPGYTHLIAVSLQGKPGKPTPDVIGRGRMIYPNAMGLNAAAFAVRFARQSSGTIVDPFCGRGTVPAVAEAMGLDAIGVDIDQAQCDHAQRLKLKEG